MQDIPPPAKRRRYDAAFPRLKPCAWPVQAARRRPLRALNIDPKRIYKWQKEALTPVAAARGAALDPAKAVNLRQASRPK